MDKGRRIITDNKNLQSSVQWSMDPKKNQKAISESVVADEFKLIGSCGVSNPKKNASSKDLLSWSPKSPANAPKGPSPTKYGAEASAANNNALPFQNEQPMAGAPSFSKRGLSIEYGKAGYSRSPQQPAQAPYGTSNTDFRGELVKQRSNNSESSGSRSRSLKTLSDALSDRKPERSAGPRSLSAYV